MAGKMAWRQRGGIGDISIRLPARAQAVDGAHIRLIYRLRTRFCARSALFSFTRSRGWWGRRLLIPRFCSPWYERYYFPSVYRCGRVSSSSILCSGRVHALEQHLRGTLRRLKLPRLFLLGNSGHRHKPSPFRASCCILVC